MLSCCVDDNVLVVLLWLKLTVFVVDYRTGSLQLLCEGLKLIRAASPESIGVQVRDGPVERPGTRCQNFSER